MSRRIIAPNLEPVSPPSGRERGAGRRPYPRLCYRRAGAYQLQHSDVVLAHAVVTPDGFAFLHAWCELPEGIVFDGADGAFYRLDDYRRHVRPVREFRYTSREVAERVLSSGEWAPWDIGPYLADFQQGRGGEQHQAAAERALAGAVPRRGR